MPVYPTDAPVGTLQGRYAFIRQDSLDAGTAVDLSPVAGEVILRCTAERPVTLASGGKYIGLVVEDYSLAINVDGDLVDKDGSTAITLLATNSPMLNRINFRWEAIFKLVDPVTGARVVLPNVVFEVPAGGTVDLPQVAQVSMSAGVPVVRGPVGPAASLTVGTFSTGAPGSPVSIQITGEPGSQVISGSIPKGDFGDVRSVNGMTGIVVIPNSSSSVAGLMVAADKAKLDGATYLPTPSTLVQRYSNGSIHVVTGTSSFDATNKQYVDTAVGTRAATAHLHDWVDFNALPEIAANVDLDTMVTTGEWHQSQSVEATVALHYPDGFAGYLKVRTSGAFVYQWYTVYGINSRSYWRGRYNGAWGPWLEVASEAALAAGLGGKANTAHTHEPADIGGTGKAAGTFLRGDGTWVVPTNTTYSVATQAEAESAASTTGRLFSGQRVAQAVAFAMASAGGTPKLRLSSTADLSETSTEHAFQVGPDTGNNVAIDDNEIAARNNGVFQPISVPGGVWGLPAPGTPSTATNRQYVDDEIATRAAVVHTHTASQVTDLTEAVQDAVAGLLAAGAGVALSYNDVGNSLTVTATGGGGGTTDPELVRDTIGAALVGLGLITVTVNDAADTITISTTATTNATDAQLRDRSTHTGAQAQSTITNLVTDLAAKAPTSHTHTAANISDASTTGRSILTAADAAAARTVLGAGTSSLAIGTTSTTAKAGDYAPTWAEVSGKPTTFAPSTHTHVKADVGLGSVDNTADSAKPVSTAQATAINLRAVKATTMAFVKWTGSTWQYADLATAVAAGIDPAQVIMFVGNPAGAAPSWARAGDLTTKA